MNEILAVVVTYNRKKLLKECLDGLLNQGYEAFDILIVDNNSTDGTDEVCKEFINKSDRIIYHNTYANLGGAGGFHFGMKYGVESGYKYLWVMDDDTIANENCLEVLVSTDKELNGKYGFLTSLTKWTDGSMCKMNMRGCWDIPVILSMHTFRRDD